MTASNSIDSAQLKMLEVANLEVDSKIGKDRHFIAADRKNVYKILLGLSSVIGTALIASAAFKEALPLINLNADQQKLAFSALSVFVGLSTAVLSFFGLEKQITQHRIVGNRYIEVARKSRRLLNTMIEDLADEKFEERFNSLLVEYLEVNRDGESCPTSRKDSKRSADLNASARGNIKAQIKKSDGHALGIESTDRYQSLIKMIKNSFKIKTACFFEKIGIISKSQYETYFKQFDRQ
ncbi:SLATT domain-containing protein [Variovorax sp. YR752]|uniref:SLATT domain-containing protein n=1 Tax=Variovorax sp. YR752 TaxID=1884383 RepID=UPI003137BF7D